MRQKVQVLKVTVEPSSVNGKNNMTLYFDHVPTCRQMMIATSAFKNGLKNKPNLKSKNLKFIVEKSSDMIRCQVVD